MQNISGTDRVGILISWIKENRELWRKLTENGCGRLIPEEYVRCLEDFNNLGLSETAAIIICINHEDFYFHDLLDEFALEYLTSKWSIEMAARIYNHVVAEAIDKGRRIKADPALRGKYYGEDEDL